MDLVSLNDNIEESIVNLNSEIEIRGGEVMWLRHRSFCCPRLTEG